MFRGDGNSNSQMYSSIVALCTTLNANTFRLSLLVHGLLYYSSFYRSHSPISKLRGKMPLNFRADKTQSCNEWPPEFLEAGRLIGRMQANPVGLEVRRDSRSRKVTCRGNLIFDKMDDGHNRLAGSLLAFPSKLVAIDVICKKCIERKVSQETSKVFRWWSPRGEPMLAASWKQRVKWSPHSSSRTAPCGTDP